jgi:hypothetical protein
VSGLVTLTGTISCNRSAQYISLYGQLQEPIAKRATLSGSFFTSIDCTAPSSRWSVNVSADNGRFIAGKATLTLSAYGCELTCDSAQLSKQVTLLGSR